MGTPDSYGSAMTERLAPFQPHPNGRRRCVEYTPQLDAQELAWAGILEHGMDGDLRPFEELTEHCEHLAGLGHDAEVMELESISILTSTSTTRRLGLSLKAGRPGTPPDHAHTTWKDLHLQAKPAPYGGHRWWFVCQGCQALRLRLYLLPCCYARCRECFGLTYRTRQEDNRASRHGHGWRRFRHLMDRCEAEEALTNRRRLRRRLGRRSSIPAEGAK